LLRNGFAGRHDRAAGRTYPLPAVHQVYVAGDDADLDHVADSCPCERLSEMNQAVKSEILARVEQRRPSERFIHRTDVPQVQNLVREPPQIAKLAHERCVVPTLPRIEPELAGPRPLRILLPALDGDDVAALVQKLLHDLMADSEIVDKY